MRTLHVLEHAHREGPERIAEVAQGLGLPVLVHRISLGAPLPTDTGAGDLLVVMGGPMSVAEPADPRWPWMPDEIAFLRNWLTRGRPVLGVCLGAQLIARAMGARVYPLVVGDPPLGHREVGWGPVRFVKTAREEPVLAGLHEAEVVLHWHGDSFDLPPGAVLLASTLPCQNQMFRLGSRAYGLQFHVEVTRELVLDWVREDADYVREALGPGGRERIVSDTEQCIQAHQRLGERLLGNLLGAMMAP
jgi:GMP synthase-like glutamine amidotransferase